MYKRQSPYSQGKHLAEDILKELKLNHPDIDMIVLRYFNPVGVDSSSLLTEENVNSDNLFPNVLNHIKNRTVFEIRGNDYPTPDGTAIRDFIHITDLVDVHRLMLVATAQSREVRIFNVGTGKGHSVKQVLDTFNKHYLRPVPYTYGPRRTGDAAKSVADTTKLINMLGWRPAHTLDDMVRDVLIAEAKISNDVKEIKDD